MSISTVLGLARIIHQPQALATVPGIVAQTGR